MDVQLLKPPTELLHFATQTVPPDLAADLLPSDLPLALLPVRLETRFFAQPDGTQQLRIRVFPDQIHVDSHEPELSADELDWGRHFWELTWRAAGDEARRRLAWQQLADHFDPQRAAWIARALRPVNIQAKPAAPLADDAPLAPAPQFPNVPLKRRRRWLAARAACAADAEPLDCDRARKRCRRRPRLQRADRVPAGARA